MTKEHSELAFAIRDLTEAVRKLSRPAVVNYVGRRSFETDLVVDTPDGPERYVRLPPIDRREAGDCGPEGIQDTPVSGPQPPAREEEVKCGPYQLNSTTGDIDGPGFGSDCFQEDVVRRLNDLADLATYYAHFYHLVEHGHQVPLKDCSWVMCKKWQRLCYVEE